MPKKLLTKEEYIEETQKREFFDITKADIETRKFRKLCMIYKKDLKGLAFEIGPNTFYFDGAGDHKICLRPFIAGADKTQYSLAKLWVVYGNEPECIRQAILKDIVKIKEEKKNAQKAIKENYEKVKREAEGGSPQEETYPEGFIRASDLI